MAIEEPYDKIDLKSPVKF